MSWSLLKQRPLRLPCSPSFPPWYLVPACCSCNSQPWSPVVTTTTTLSPPHLTTTIAPLDPPAPQCPIFISEAKFEVYKPASDFCEIVVFALAGHCQLELTFRQFWLVDSPGCASEHLQVDGRSFCGHQAAGQTGIQRKEIVNLHLIVDSLYGNDSDYREKRWQG